MNVKNKQSELSFEAKIMNLHELVNEYIRTRETLYSFADYLRNCDKVDLKPLQNFSKLIPKLKNLLSQIMSQYKNEDTFVAIYELKRMGDPKLGEKSVADVVIEEYSHE